MCEASNILNKSTNKDNFFLLPSGFLVYSSKFPVWILIKTRIKMRFLLWKCAFWILASIRNYIYLVILRSAFATVFHLLVANQNSSWDQLIRDLIFVLRQLGIYWVTDSSHRSTVATIVSDVCYPDSSYPDCSYFCCRQLLP